MKLSTFALILLAVCLPANGQEIAQVTSVAVPTSAKNSFLAANWSKKELYTTDSNSLTVIDTESWLVKKVIPLNYPPTDGGPCISPSGIIAIPNGSEGRVTIINPETGEVRNLTSSPSSQIGFIVSSWGCAFSTDDRTLYVSSNSRLLTNDSRIKNLIGIRTADWVIAQGWQVVDITKGSVAQIATLPDGRVYAVIYGPFPSIGSLVAFEPPGGSTKVIDVNLVPRVIITAPNGRVYVSGSTEDVTVRATTVIDTETDKVLEKWEGDRYLKTPCVFPSASDPWFAYTAEYSALTGVNIAQQTNLFSRIQDLGPAYGLAANRQPDGSDVLALLRDGRVDVFRAVQPTTLYFVTNGASFSTDPVVSPGEWVSLFGRSLSYRTVTAKDVPLPTELEGTRVWISIGNNLPVALPLVFASINQINAQFPTEVPVGASVKLWVEGPGNQKSDPVTVSVIAATPALFAWPDRSPILADANGQLIFQVAPGSVFTAYATGLGQVLPQVASGSPAPFNPLAWTVNQVQVFVAGRPCLVLFSGLSPGWVGLYQLNIQIPADIPTGKQSLIIQQANTSVEYQITVSGGSIQWPSIPDSPALVLTRASGVFVLPRLNSAPTAPSGLVKF